MHCSGECTMARHGRQQRAGNLQLAAGVTRMASSVSLTIRYLQSYLYSHPVQYYLYCTHLPWYLPPVHLFSFLLCLGAQLKVSRTLGWTVVCGRDVDCR